MSIYYDELMLFKTRHQMLQKIAEHRLGDFAAELTKSPEKALSNVYLIAKYTAVKNLARSLIEQIGRIYEDAGDIDPEPKANKLFHTLLSQCENELIACSTTPRDLTVGEQLLYDAVRSQYAEELVHLSQRRSHIERNK